ncbi:hypothetical protein P7D22_13590 [Lichenihabitans sp. Uapishka_5]|uniref:hypothetical protein n=1 Tax=Lichenihabitans sp. Uapishka_5 TaxID=3037302 RepID=UPI0029E7EC72|nr:hypothetical protein [Lichenihabitans sp. Uapishka_5]MDX7952208.1 hypothetical protein [Lichenihabitans sp. Uapishka_5]
MDAVSAEQFLKDQLPLAARALIPTTLRTAYEAVRLIVKDEPILNVPSAYDNRGRLITWAVDRGFEILLQTQRWPFEHRWSSFAQPTGRYLQVRLGHSTLTISQVANPKHQPRNVIFRENGRLNNAPFFNLPEFDDTREVHGLPHFILVHGHQDLNFAHVGVPHSQHHRDWLYKTPNLMKLPHVVESDLPPAEETDFTAALELKDQIDKWRRDNDA